MATAYLGRTDARHPLASPLYADPRGLPPLLVHVGEVEVLRDDSLRLVDAVRGADGEVDLHVGAGMVHVWHLFAGIAPESDAALAELAKVGFDPVFGARPLKRAIQQRLENPLSRQLLEGRFLPGSRIAVGVDPVRHPGQFEFSAQAPQD